MPSRTLHVVQDVIVLRVENLANTCSGSPSLPTAVAGTRSRTGQRRQALVREVSHVGLVPALICDGGAGLPAAWPEAITAQAG
jgi:hypothetical protein